PFLAKIDAANSIEDIQRLIAFLHNEGIPSVFTFGVGADLKDSNAVLINTSQGGLSLPHSDYYTNPDARSVETRAKFVEYATRMFRLIGDDEQAAANAAKLLELQTRLAKASLTPVERRNPDNNYNK